MKRHGNNLGERFGTMMRSFATYEVCDSLTNGNTGSTMAMYVGANVLHEAKKSYHKKNK